MNDFLRQPVSVIGNAESILQNDHGKLIDSNATIRFNRADIIDEKSQGSRWDYLASSEINTFEKYNQQVPKFHTLIFTPTNFEMQYKIKKVKFDCKQMTLPIKQSLELKNILNATPSTGLQVLYFLAGIKNKDVSIFGFDFKNTKTFYEIREKGSHDYQKEKNFILELIKRNNWKIYLDTDT